MWPLPVCDRPVWDRPVCDHPVGICHGFKEGKWPCGGGRRSLEPDLYSWVYDFEVQTGLVRYDCIWFRNTCDGAVSYMICSVLKKEGII